MSVRWRNVRGGTPMHDRSLCSSCTYAHHVKGAAVSEEFVICEAIYNKPERVPFQPVVECTSYLETNKPSLWEMQKIAYILESDHRGRPIGFKPNKDFRAEHGMDKNDDLTDGY